MTWYDVFTLFCGRLVGGHGFNLHSDFREKQMKTIALALMVAVIVEAIVEYGNTIYEMVIDREYQKAVKQGSAIAVAVLFAFMCHVTLLSWLMSDAFGITVNPIFDMVVSGIFMSRGANYLSNLIRLILNAGSGDDDDFWNMFDFEDGDDDGTSSEENEN